MIGLRIDRLRLVVVLTCLMVFGSAGKSFGQSERAAGASGPAMDVDLEVQLHLVVASTSGEIGKMPASLEGVAKQLRSSLPFTNYRLGATHLCRVKNGRPVSVRGVGRNLLTTPALESSVLPTFYDITAGMLTLKADGSGHPIVQITGFRFGLRIPLQSGLGQGKAGGENSILYEPVGITTDVTIPEGQPVVIGTLDAGRPNESFVLVLVVRRASAQ